MTTYQVALPVFEGPFDLLLQLIERERLDISSVSLALVTDQFLAYVTGMEEARPDELADFLTVGSRLVLIKSRLLLPRPPSTGDEEEEEDPAEALARQLREYKRFKEVAAVLRAIEENDRRTFWRNAPPPDLERRLAVDELSLTELLAAAHSALAALPPQPMPEGIVVPFTLTIQDQIRLIGRVTTNGRTVTFHSLVQGAIHRLEVIVTLLAILELIKRKQITVAQSTMFGEIEIAAAPGAEITADISEDSNNGRDDPPNYAS
jgi:segregation and condensation protein A